MGIFKNLRNRLFKNRGQPIGEGMDFLDVLGLDVNNIENSSELSETIYYICMKHLTETLSKMPWEVIQKTEKKGKEKKFNSNLDLLLNVRPNPYYSASTLWGTVELNKLHYGNAYVYIEMGKFTGKLKHLWVLPSEDMKVWIDDKGIIGRKDAIWYVWTDRKTGTEYKFAQRSILHFKTSISFNGLTGMPIKEILRTQISSGKNAIGFLNKLYKANMFGSKVILHYTGELSTKKEQNMARKIESFAKNKGSGKFIPLPLGTTAQLLDMKLADAQFFENNKNSALQLAAAFGIKPNVINDYTKSSYSSSESQQIDFFVNTLQPLFSTYEQELTYKLFHEVELQEGYRLVINEKILFKMDNKTKSEVYSKYVMNFVMTPNEVREELNLPYVEDGNKLLGNGNAIGINDVGRQYKKKGGGK